MELLIADTKIQAAIPNANEWEKLTLATPLRSQAKHMASPASQQPSDKLHRLSEQYIRDHIDSSIVVVDENDIHGNEANASLFIDAIEISLEEKGTHSESHSTSETSDGWLVLPDSSDVDEFSLLSLQVSTSTADF